MYKLFQKLVSICVIASMVFANGAIVFAKTTEQQGIKKEIVSQETYYDENNELVERTITKITYPSVRSSVYERVTYVTKDKGRNYTVSLTATFSYNVADKKVSCVSKYSTYSQNFGLKNESLTDTGSGKKCTVTLKYSHNSGLGYTTKTLKLKCNYKGNLV